MSVDEEAPVTAGMLEPGDSICINGKDTDYEVEVDFDPEAEPPWVESSDFVPVLLFENTRNVSVRQVGCEDEEEVSLKVAGLDLVPMETILEHRQALLDLVGAGRDEVKEAVPDGDGSAFWDFLAGKVDERCPRAWQAVEQPRENIDDYFGLLEGVFRTVGIPARRFHVPSEGGVVASGLMALTPGWQAAAFGESEPRLAFPVLDGILEEKVETFREQYMEYRRRGIYMVQIWDADTEDMIEAGGNFYDMAAVAEYASRLIRDCEARTEPDPEP